MDRRMEKFQFYTNQYSMIPKILHIPIHHRHYNSQEYTRCCGNHQERVPVLLVLQISRRFITPIVSQFTTISRDIQVIYFTIFTIHTNPKCVLIHTFKMEHLHIFQYNLIWVFCKSTHLSDYPILQE